MLFNARLSALALPLGFVLLVRAASDGVLRRSFYGMAYTPDGALLPDCGATQADVTRDIELLAQVTPRIRLYASDCNQTALVLQAVQDTRVDLTIWLGIFIDGNDTVYNRQIDTLTDALRTYGTEHVAGITVGNEYVLNKEQDGTDPTGVQATTTLVDYISRTNETIKGLDLDKYIPIGTADAGGYVQLALCQGADYVFANVHPWFAGVTVDAAAEWTNTFFKENNVNLCAQATNNPEVWNAETGWPTDSMNASQKTETAAQNRPISDAGLQTFIDTFVCQANANHTKYFWFEAIDAEWKESFGGVEPYWGLFTKEREMKDVTIPNCLVDSPTSREPSTPSSTNGGRNPSPTGSGSEGGASDGSGDHPGNGAGTVAPGVVIALAAALFISVLGW